MFWNKEKDKKHGHEYEISSEDLAFPEIHIGKRKKEEHASEHHDSITYDDVAIPEVHIPVRKKK
ncbi:hypothetical protein DXA97_07865 [Clostridium sp. OF09-36]|uniref:hypothetical protein n=1 Tax=Clostridium sp. OF09-36 TaxID=2292310 RepID=UPI000E4CEC34|nr:hypothetical protein [Clostridium sp. OF09-36]RHV88083.1 hypothetical protein DXA97_07865 [Clostridium sp. OF09-36]